MRNRKDYLIKTHRFQKKSKFELKVHLNLNQIALFKHIEA